MSEQQALRGDELNAAITSAMVGVHREHLGRGPRKATTFHHENVITTLMYDVMTPIELTLSKGEKADIVLGMRHLLQQAMQSDFTAAIERLSGRKVLAFISGNSTAPDIAAELFVLDSSL